MDRTGAAFSARGFFTNLSRALVIILASACLALAEKPVTVAVEAEAFQFWGDWAMQTGHSRWSGSGYLFAGEAGAELPAVTGIELPRAGTYHLWVRSLDFPEYQPGRRRFTVSINGETVDRTFGNAGREGWAWQHGGEVELTAGRVLIGIHDVAHFYGRVDAILLTTDANLKPTDHLGKRPLPRPTKPIDLPYTQAVRDGIAGPYTQQPTAERPADLTDAESAAVLENEHVRIAFQPATWNEQSTVVPVVSLRNGDDWQPMPADTAAEAYVVTAGHQIAMDYFDGLPRWSRPEQTNATVKIGDVSIDTARRSQRPEIWRAGDPYRFQPKHAEQADDAVEITFHPSPVGTLKARWELKPGERAARVKLTFVPAQPGEYAVGYHLFFRRELADIQELQLPFMWQRKRFPKEAATVLDPRTPTPISLAQTGTGDESVAWAVVGDPAEIPFRWPDDRYPNFGMAIRDDFGKVQPAIYGPVPGTPQARREAGKRLTFRFRVLVQRGDWYAGFRTAADQVFGFRDYRRNGPVSMTEAALNMIDLVMDDEFGGWWRRAKGWYQIESKNGASHATPASVVSLYRLTGDEAIYDRRVVPTLEYVLSRDTAHFSPEPHDTGRYPIGGMTGPASLFGTTTFLTLSEMTHGYTPAFRKIAMPEARQIRHTVGYSHARPFNEWAARYKVTGDPEDLETAKRLADKYIDRVIKKPPTGSIHYSAFWLLSFVPDWEGLLMMYELTGEQRYLDAAAFGARQLMTGIWVQPTYPDGQATIFPGGKYESDPWHHRLAAKGPFEYRLGQPLAEGVLTEHKAPAWQVSAVGLGFEQPSTLGEQFHRLIYQAVWAPEFLRLARYTGDEAFETHARNAAVGRWGNYPGYYVGGHFDLNQQAGYPYVGPDLSMIYYHHIVPHLSWTIDYLVADAELLSDGKITFPGERENGYAFFDGKIYGHAPGRIFDEQDCWLWFRRGAVVLNNPQINHLAAYNDRSFFTILMNQDTQPQNVRLSFSQQVIGFDPVEVKTVVMKTPGGEQALELDAGSVEVKLPARGLAVVRLDGANIDVPAHTVPAKPEQGPYPSMVEVGEGEIRAKAAAIQAAPGPWRAYIWCTANADQARRVTLHYDLGAGPQHVTDADYPFEFSISVADPATPVVFHLEGERADGEDFELPEATLGAVRSASEHESVPQD